MPYIDVSDLDVKRLQKLEAEGTPEDRFLEYKREITSGRELAKDISAFANSGGGVIIYGVAEMEGKPKIVGIETAGSTEAVDNVVANALSPRVNVLTKLIPLPDSDRAVLAVWIAESDLKPHMVSAYGDQRYYVRKNTANLPMDQVEIAQAYRLRTKAQDEAEIFAKRIIDSRYATRFPDRPWASLICVPRFLRDDALPIDNEMRDWLMEQRFRWTRLFNGSPHVGPKGFEIYHETENIPQFRYATIGLQGYVEAAVVMDPFGRNSLASWTLTEVTMQFLTFCGLLYDKLSYNGMVKLFMGADQVGKLVLGVDPVKYMFEEAAKLQANEVHVYRSEAAASLRTENRRICKLFMDRVYQAAGLMSCDYFTPKGELVPPRSA